MEKTVFCSLLAATFAVSAFGSVWRNLDDENRQGGRKTSEGYLLGKVVLVCRDAAQMPRMETVWQSFKSKPFVLIGAGKEKNASCTFPMYSGAGLAADEPDTPLYVVGGTGKVVYKGADDRAATEEVVTALTDMESPRSLGQWKAMLDFELEKLPAHAYLRFSAFKKKFPAAAREYDAKIKDLRAVKDVDKVAKLVNLAKQAKDMREFGPKKKMQQAKFVKNVKSSISTYAALKDCEDPRLAQEAKNSLADLQWTYLAFK